MIFNPAAGAAGGGLPEFEYTGQYQLIDEGRQNGVRNWRIRFLTSGVITFARLRTAIDVFLVGGGGARGNASGFAPASGSGGGGYTKTEPGLVAEIGQAYEIVIGAGGTTPASSDSTTRGGSTTAFGCTAEGGYSGYRHSGGDGGSGGADAQGTTRATDGADGEDTSSSAGTAGKGQGTTTREFGEADGTLYATGGAQGSGNGDANTGDGAGGITSDDNGVARTGGSGIVVIRNAR